MRLGADTASGRAAVVVGLIFLATLLPACTTKSPTAVIPASAAPSAKPPSRPAALPPGTYETMKLRAQRMRTVGFKDKATGELIDARLAQARPPAELDLVPGDYDELTYDRGQLRFATYGHEPNAQPYVVEKVLPREEWQALEDGLNADGYFSMNKTNWDADKRFPMFYLLYTVGDAGYESSFTPNLAKLKKTGPLLNGWFDVLGGRGRMPAKAEHMAFGQSIIQGQMRVVASRLTPDVNGDAQDKPFNLRKAEYDTGKGFQEAVVGPLENAFEYPRPAGKGEVVMVAVKLTSEDGSVYQTVLPVKTGP